MPPEHGGISTLTGVTVLQCYLNNRLTCCQAFQGTQ